MIEAQTEIAPSFLASSPHRSPGFLDPAAVAETDRNEKIFSCLKSGAKCT